jgi:ribonuclease J
LPGHTESESSIGENIDRAFAKAKGRIIVASFASNLNRIQQMIDASARHGRKIAIQGRSMVNNVNIAMELGYLNVPKGILVPPQKANTLPPHQVTILTTGSQGETYSALVRMAQGSHKQVQIRKGDTVFISATPIPGNEGSVYQTIDDLYRLGAEVIYSAVTDVHVSGHARREEHKLILNIVKPKYFMPVHGEHRHLIHHAEMAVAMGVAKDNVFIMENGNTIEMTRQESTVDRRNTNGYLLVDGQGIGDIGNVVLKDREVMSESGMLMVVVNLRKDKAEIIGVPEIISRGFVYMKESRELIRDVIQMVMEIVDRARKDRAKPDVTKIRGDIKVKLQDVLYERTGREPMILPVVIEIEE